MISSARHTLRRGWIARASRRQLRVASRTNAMSQTRLFPLTRTLPYSTEKVLELRGAAPGTQTLYNGKDEKENCGVGLIASLKSVPSRKIVERADEMLVRMAHRGGCGCDPASGDGSGKSLLLSILEAYRVSLTHNVLL